MERADDGLLILDHHRKTHSACTASCQDTDRVELLSDLKPGKNKSTTFRNLSRMRLMLENAHEIVEKDPMFHISRAR